MKKKLALILAGTAMAAMVLAGCGWELVKKPLNWDSKDMELNSGSIDCIWNGFTMNGREDDYTFSTPYVDNSQVIVVAEKSGIDTLEDLAGKTVGVQAASAALDLPSFRQARWMHLQSMWELPIIRSSPEGKDIRFWMRH